MVFLFTLTLGLTLGALFIHSYKSYWVYTADLWTIDSTPGNRSGYLGGVLRLSPIRFQKFLVVFGKKFTLIDKIVWEFI